MVEFETVSAEEIRFGRNNFIEVSRKKAMTDGEDREFISISRGWYGADEQKRWKTSLTIPDDKDILSQIADLLKKL